MTTQAALTTLFTASCVLFSIAGTVTLLTRDRKPKPKRLELKLVSYDEADAMLSAGWTIAREEDANHIPCMIWLERLEEVCEAFLLPVWKSAPNGNALLHPCQHSEGARTA